MDGQLWKTQNLREFLEACRALPATDSNKRMAELVMAI